MTTRINIFNEGPGVIEVEEIEGSLEAVVNIRRTTLGTAQGIETYIWKEKAIIIKEE